MKCHIPISVTAFLGLMIFNGVKCQDMKEKSTMAYDTAKELVVKKNGVLNEQLGTAIEIYKLEDGSAVVLNNVSHFAEFYPNADDVLKRNKRPFNLIEKYQADLKDFPSNKDSILTDLSSKLKIRIDPTNLDMIYLKKVSDAVKRLPGDRVRNSLYLGLIVFLGETIMQIRGGAWELTTSNFPTQNLLFPKLVDSAGRENQFALKMVSDAIDDIAKFDWPSMVLFWTNIDNIQAGPPITGGNN